MEIGGQMIRPVDFTSAILFKGWKLGEDEGDLTVMRVVISGREKGHTVKITCDLYDEYDPGTGIHSMARTTGYTCTAVATLLLEGRYGRKGICPPEFIGSVAGNLEYVTGYLGDRGVTCNVSVERN